MKHIDKSQIPEIIKSDVPVLLELRSYECPACIVAEKFLLVLEKAYANKLLFYIADVDDDLRQMFDITKVPQFVMFKKGKEVVRFSGFINEIEFEKKLREGLKTNGYV